MTPRRRRFCKRLPSPVGGRGAGGEGDWTASRSPLIPEIPCAAGPPSPDRFAATLSRKREREVCWLPATHWLLLLLSLLAIGCTRDLDRDYGRRQGPGRDKSVNGTGVLAKMFQESGHKVFSWTTLSPRLKKRADCIVWFPDDFQPPSQEARDWLETWLTDRPGRTLIYVGRDFDAAWPYWQKVERLASDDQRDEIRRRKTAARVDFLVARQAIPKSDDCDWFTVEGKYRPRKVRSLEGDPEWLAGIDPAGLEIELSGRMLPSSYADVMLASDGDMLVSVESWDQSRAIMVANGSFLLNVPLVNHEHRKLAGKLIDAIGPPGQTVVFLESGPTGPPVRDTDPTGKIPTGMEIFNIWPTNWILLHLAVAGILFCFSRWPIFGRPREPEPPPPSDFGRHVEALGELLERSGDAQFAAARLAHCREVLTPAGSANPKSEIRNPKAQARNHARIAL